MLWVTGLTPFQFSLIYFGYIVIFLVSMLGNSAIIHIVRTDNSMKTTVNYLILNQACSDILISLIQLLNIVHYSLHYRLWFTGIGGLITCKLFLASCFILPAFSIWILVTIAIERYFAVARPLQSSPISQHLKKIIYLLWAWSIVSSTGLITKVHVVKINESYYCTLVTVVWDWKHFNIISLMLNVLVPLLILAVLYTMICIKLWSHQVPGDNSNQRQADAIKTAKKVTRMMLAIVFLFLVCWLPLLILIVLQLTDYVKISYDVLLFPIWLTVAYSGLNPYVYFTFSVNFRRALKHLLRNIYISLPFQSQSVELQQI